MFYTQQQRDAMVFKIEHDYKELLKKAHHVFRLAIKKNSKKNPVFIDYSGHVQKLSLRIDYGAKMNALEVGGEWLSLKEPDVKSDLEYTLFDLTNRHRVIDLYIKTLNELK